jgi:hypothetical protein
MIKGDENNAWSIEHWFAEIDPGLCPKGHLPGKYEKVKNIIGYEKKRTDHAAGINGSIFASAGIHHR